MPIYTRTGDDGTTALFGGKRVLKSDELIGAYGSIDELNSWIGEIGTELSVPDILYFLQSIQSDLFTIGSVFAGWKGSLAGPEHRIAEMEARIDVLEKELEPLSNFVIPGGSPLSARLHIARSICRRVERQIVSLHQKQRIDRIILKYFNRLSDLLFTLARFINKQQHIPDRIWSGIKQK